MDRSRTDAEEELRARAAERSGFAEHPELQSSPRGALLPWEQGPASAGSAGLVDDPGLRGSSLEHDLAAELAAARQRLSYYERFDSLINDSVQRSADLFQALFTEREAQRRASTTMFSEVSAAVYAESMQLMADERQRMSETLLGIMTDASRLQRQIDGLIQQIAEAVTDLSTRSAGHDRPTTGA